MFSVRPGVERDLERVAAIRLRSWSDTYASLIPPQILRRYLDAAWQLADIRDSVARPDALLLVATNPTDATADVIGFSLSFLDHRPEPLLESLHVLSGNRGRGAGTALMRATAAEMIARGHRTMRLGVIAGNDAAERFYERLGGVRAGAEPVSWADGVIHHMFRWPDLVALA